MVVQAGISGPASGTPFEVVGSGLRDSISASNDRQGSAAIKSRKRGFLMFLNEQD